MPGERRKIKLFVSTQKAAALRQARPGLYIYLKGEELRKAVAAKAIEGQQGLMNPIGPQDPMYATHAQRGKPSEAIHTEAAKHYIQADYHGRHPGGWEQAQYHHKQFMNLRKQGAQPTAAHFKMAMQELHPKFSQAMKSQGLFVSL
jgi:hypothetical protein